jgi:hypothetical protein
MQYSSSYTHTQSNNRSKCKGNSTKSALNIGLAVLSGFSKAGRAAAAEEGGTLNPTSYVN